MKVLEDELQRTFECGRIIEELHHEQRRIRPAPRRELFGRIERAGPRALQRGCDGQPECFRVIGSVVERQPGAVGARQPLRGKCRLPGPGARGHDADAPVVTAHPRHEPRPRDRVPGKARGRDLGFRRSWPDDHCGDQWILPCVPGTS